MFVITIPKYTHTQQAEEGVYARAGRLLDQNSDLLLASDSEGIEKVRSGRYAFIKVSQLAPPVARLGTLRRGGNFTNFEHTGCHYP